MKCGVHTLPNRLRHQCYYISSRIRISIGRLLHGGSWRRVRPIKIPDKVLCNIGIVPKMHGQVVALCIWGDDVHIQFGADADLVLEVTPDNGEKLSVSVFFY